ncbi:phosducin-like protein 2 [Eumetopias jubatus]|uniref:phosducin-like protein 2 n=1 Tax=Eumetopias jubatus TaxID=34886 RepID=UPI0010164570|nr:phosducin-like protein 2 [Eumetopias jubatus]
MPWTWCICTHSNAPTPAAPPRCLATKLHSAARMRRRPLFAPPPPLGWWQPLGLAGLHFEGDFGVSQGSFTSGRTTTAHEGKGEHHAVLNEDTEWNEILRDFGILPPKEEPKDEIEEMVLRLQKEAMVKPYEKMTLAQLKEAEDEFDEEDMRAIEIYREKRLQEWKALRKKQKFGELREISGNQYVNEVTNAEKDVSVIIHLYRSSIPMCLLVNQHLSLLARKFPETKFVKAIVNSCIQHYHDNCLPTIFVYKNGQIEGKFIGIIECGGINLKLEELEWKLAEVGAIQTDLEENPKKGIVDVMVSSIRNTSFYDDTSSSNSDNDDTK